VPSPPGLAAGVSRPRCRETQRRSVAVRHGRPPPASQRRYYRRKRVCVVIDEAQSRLASRLRAGRVLYADRTLIWAGGGRYGMALIWPLSPARPCEWPVCGARVCGEQDSGRSTLRFTILPRRTFREGDLRHHDLWRAGLLHAEDTQRIGTRDPRPAEASHSLAMRGLFHTPAARDSDMHVASMSLQNTKHDDLQPRRWRFVYSMYCAIKHVAG